MTALRDPRFWIRVIGLILVLLAVCIPPIRVSRNVYALVAVLDITGSMNVRDQRLDGTDASRLAMEKRAVRRLLSSLPCGSRLGIAIFVEKQPFLLFEPMEVCENFTPIDEEITAIDWRMGWDSESHIAAGLHSAMTLANRLGADLVFLTDGQETPPLWWNASPDFASLRHSIGGLIVGVGGTTFSPIPKFDGYGREVGVFKPGDVPLEKDGMFHGREHLSAVDEPHLRTLAASSGLTYLHLGEEDSLFAAVQHDARPRTQVDHIKLRWPFSTAALTLLIAASIQKLFVPLSQRRAT